jgi:hypothetical protein
MAWIKVLFVITDVSLAGSDSCHLRQSVPFDITDFEDPDLASVRVMLQYMSDRMYDKIRGQGWTYGVSISASVEEGRVTLSFIRSSHINNAYQEFRNIISNYTNIGKYIWKFGFYLKGSFWLFTFHFMFFYLNWREFPRAKSFQFS